MSTIEMMNDAQFMVMDAFSFYCRHGDGCLD